MDPPVDRFTCSGGKKSSVNGTFAYISLFSSPSLPSDSWFFHKSLRRVLTAKATKESTCRSMETGYLPVTFCRKISSAVALLVRLNS